MENINVDENGYYRCPTCKFLPTHSPTCVIARKTIPVVCCNSYEHMHAYKNKLDQIRKRLKKTTAGHWVAVDPKSEYTHNGRKYLTEDMAILTKEGEEVLGASEWLRCDMNDLNFMAYAKEDIEWLMERCDK